MEHGGDERDHRIELARAVARARERGTTTLDDVAVWTITAALLELELTPEIRRAAAAVQPATVRPRRGSAQLRAHPGRRRAKRGG
jgi:hypothetical protein